MTAPCDKPVRQASETGLWDRPLRQPSGTALWDCPLRGCRTPGLPPHGKAHPPSFCHPPGLPTPSFRHPPGLIAHPLILPPPGIAHPPSFCHPHFATPRDCSPPPFCHRFCADFVLHDRLFGHPHTGRSPLFFPPCHHDGAGGGGLCFDATPSPLPPRRWPPPRMTCPPVGQCGRGGEGAGRGLGPHACGLTGGQGGEEGWSDRPIGGGGGGGFFVCFGGDGRRGKGGGTCEWWGLEPADSWTGPLGLPCLTPKLRREGHAGGALHGMSAVTAGLPQPSTRLPAHFPPPFSPFK